MKIYATTNNSDFDQFVGQDVWVRVDYHYCQSNYIGDYYFIKVLNKFDNGEYRYCSVNMELSNICHFTISEFVSYIKYPKQWFGSLQGYSIHLPLEVYTTQDFIDTMLGEDN